MLRFFLLNFLLFSCLILIAQPTRDQHPLSQILANTRVYVMEKDNSETIVKGSHYYMDDFSAGWVLLQESRDTIQDLYLKYNIYHNILEWRVSKNEIKNLLIDRVASFGFEDDFFVNAQQLESGQKGFFKNVYRGEVVSIYTKESIKRKYIKAKPPFEEKNSIIFYKTEETYLYHDGRMHLINTKKQLESLINSWEMRSLKSKKSDLQNEAFLQSLGERIESHLTSK
ncbi:hypothetical protein [Ekhidna sp.]|uniref:hypothetical protein n=1 Tax=Ekhidna sp. TaxID=2608089 RepID=UPI003BA9D563